MKNNFQSKAVPRGTRTIWRYLGALFLIFTLSIGQMLAADPTLSFGTTSATTSTYLGTYETEGITISSDRSYSSGMVQLGSTPSNYNSYYVQVSAGVAIDSIHVLMSGNGSNKNLHAPMFGWATSATSNDADTYSYPAEQTTNGNGYTYAKWFKYDMTGASVKCTRIYRSVKNVSSANPSYTGSSTALGSGQTIQIYGMKIWLHKHTVTLNPNGGSYASTPEGWTLSAGKYTKAVFDGSLVLPEPTNSGNTFAGWKNKNNEDVLSPITVSRDTVLTAQWTPKGGTTHNITYNETSLKGQSVSGYPTTYYEGTGIASFAALADVTDWHFNGWDPASISDTEDQNVEVFATWVAAYNVTFSAGAGSGTVPTSFQKWEGAKFNLPGQGSMTAPAGKAFDGWKAGGTKYAENAEYTMGNDAVEFVAQWKALPQTIYYWQSSYSGNPTMNSAVNVTGGTIEWKTDDNNKSWANESYNKGSNVVPADLQVASGKKAVKSGGNALYAELTLAGTATFQEGDTIYVGGYKKWMFSTTKQRYDGTSPSDDPTKPMSGDIALVTTGSSNSSYDDGYAVIPAGVNVSTMYLIRGEGASSSIAAIKVVRPAQKDVKSTVYDLTAVKINGTAISAADLAILKTGEAYLLDLATGYPVGPTVKFARQTTTTYEDDSQKVATDTITVTASEVSSKWQAQATIGTITYTVKAAKQSSAKVYYYDGETKIGEEPVAIGGHPAEYAAKQSKNLATFVDWYSDADLADGHLISDIAAMTVSEDVSVYGKWTYTYAQSVNVEKWVLDNTKTPNSDKTGALISLLGTRGFASNLAYVEKNLELDSLNDSKGTGRNYTYLGLKVKSAGKLLDFRLAKDNTVKVKFGNVGATPLLAINGGEYAAMTIVDGVFAYTATGNDYISIKTATDAAVVFQQIMIGEDIQDVTLPEPTRHAVDLTKAGETEHGTLAVASPEEYNWLAKDVEVTLTVAADEGYYIESVTLNGEALTPSENVYSFAMPNAKANVVATFAEIVPNNVTYKANNGGADADILAENATEIAGCSFTYAGHKFNGWNTAPDGTGNAYAEGDAVLSPLTLYAQWKEYFVITYMDGEDVLGTEDVFVGEAPVSIADPVKAMNIFQGWTLAGSDEVIDVTSLNATTTVYAKWEAIDACFYFSAKSVDADEAITTPANLDNAFGGTLEAASGTFTYTQYGVLIAGGSDKYFTVNLDYALQEGSKIALKLYAGGTSERGLNLRVAGSSSNVYQYKWTPSATEPAQMEYEYEYVVPANSPLIGKKVFYLYRNNNVYLQTVMVKDCAPQDYTVTYKDGETVLGTEQVFENAHPTADGINTHKKGYEFQGWAETVDGAVVDLDDITITAAKNLFAQYTVKDCSPKGVKFSMAIDGSKISANQYYPATTPAVGDLAVFATVTGGVAQAVNTSTGSTKNFEVKTTPEFKLGGNNSHMRILLDCPLAENDTIKFTKSEKITLSFDSLKTKRENIAKTTSYYIVPAAYAGEDTIHIWYNGSGVSVNGVQVIRPEIYAVSFNLNGHGSAIAPIDVVKGAKITAPTAPEDEDYAFAGWYKENTLSNEWKFDVDVVTANTTLYAKWIDMSDATLKWLKYGAEEIALQAGVYTYNVELPALTTAVPALSAETSNPNATKVITDETAFDGEGHATSTVVVTPEKAGAATQTYTVNFAKAASVALQDVTGSITWNFANAVTANVNITGTPQVLANYAGVTNDNTFESDKLEASGEKFTAGSNANLRANYIRFHTTVPGKLSISYSNTGGSNPARYIYVNGVKYDEEGSASTTKKGLDTKVFVPAGDVELVMKDGEDVSKNVQIYQMIFNATPDYKRGVTEGRYGTICLPNGGVMVGAEIFEIAYYGETSKKIFLDNIPSGEMVAGRPYIFLPKEGTTQLAVFYTDETNASAGSHNGLIGFIGDAADEYFYIPAGQGNYILQNNLYREVLAGGQARILSNRAYIKLSAINQTEPALAPGRRRVAMGVLSEQVATGCENLNISDKPVKMIINGQLFILRGEKMYDAKGQLVK